MPIEQSRICKRKSAGLSQDLRCLLYNYNMFFLLRPRYYAVKNRISRLAPGDGVRTVVLGLLAALFWLFMYTVSFRVLSYFRGIEGLGDLLAFRLLAMIMLTFFSILLFSNIVTALSTFYLSDELFILLSAPLETSEIFRSKFIETLMDSSWMVMVYGLPVFIAYGAVFKAPSAYYIGVLLALPPFLMISAAVGITITMLLVNAFPARRAKDILVLMGLLSFVVLYILFRLLRPERLVDPDAFPTLIQYLTAMRAPLSPLLPSSWAADALSPLLRGADGYLFHFLMLWSTALFGFVATEWICSRIYYSGWSRSQEGKKAPISRSIIANMTFRLLSRPFPGKMRTVAEKDLKLFFRDTTQWSQLFLIFALMFVYLYSFRLLPIERAQMPSFFLQNLISFLNLGLVGFIVSAVSVRFVFPAVSLEGEAFWVIRSSPLPLKDFLSAKFWSSLIPLIVLAEALIILSNIFLKVTPFMMTISVVSIFMLTFGITALGVGMGAAFPRFRYENAAQIPTGFGGIVYMLISLIFIGLVIVLEAWPVYRIFTAETMGSRISVAGWIRIAISFSLVLALNLIAVILPLKIGLKRLENREI